LLDAPPIGSPAVALQHPGEVLAENLGGVLVAAAGGDQIQERRML